MPRTPPRRQVSVRTVPKLMPFIVGAVAVAFTASVLVVYSTPPAEDYTRAASLGYITFVFLLPALALSVTAWLTVERILRKRQRSGSIERVRQNGTEDPSERNSADGSR